MSSSSAVLILFFPLILLLIIPVSIGIYVWRDAKRRRMNAVLWTIIAVFAPTLIGFIVYLLVRNSYSDLECPSCRTPVTKEYAVCPKCGAKLRMSCPQCAFPVEPDWKVCPHCAAPLPEDVREVTPPVRRKDKALWKILVAVIILPIIAIGILFAAMSLPTGTGSCGLQEVPFDEYKEIVSETVYQEVQADLSGMVQQQSLDKAYALRYERNVNGSSEYFYLLVIPGAGDQTHTSFGQSTGLFGTTLEIDLAWTGDDGSVFCLISSAANPPRLKITVGDKKLDCEIKDVSYNPTVYLTEP